MSDAALRTDVVQALKDASASGVVVTEHIDGSVEISKSGQMLRRFPFGTTVARGLLAKFERWYGIPMAAFYPRTSVTPQTNAAGE